jgi:hypothetical protein
MSRGPVARQTFARLLIAVSPRKIATTYTPVLFSIWSTPYPAHIPLEVAGGSAHARDSPQRPAPKALLLGNIPADPRAAPKRKTGLSRRRSRVSSQQLGPELAVAVADQGQLQHSPNNLQTDKLLTRRVATTRAPRFQSMWVI